MNFPKIISLAKAWGYIPQKNIFKNFLLKRIGHPHPYGRLRAISVMKHIKLENKNLLDAGCGTGTFSRELVLRGFKVTGVDSDNDAIKSCINGMQQLNLDYPVIKESIMDLKSFKDETFGFKIKLFIEINSDKNNEDLKNKMQLVFNTNLTKNEEPDEIIFKKNIKKTSTGKNIKYLYR